VDAVDKLQPVIPATVEASKQNATGVHNLCATFLAAPAEAVLPTPSVTPAITAQPEPEFTITTTVKEQSARAVKRRSTRLAALTPSSPKPTERARDTKLKKWGLLETAAQDPKEVKKQHILSSYQGGDCAVAEEALADLFGQKTQAAKVRPILFHVVSLFQCIIY
jgi:hypothetical protein